MQPALLTSVRDGLRLAHPHGAARGQPPARLRLVVRHRRRPNYAARTGQKAHDKISVVEMPEGQPGGREGRQRAGPVPRRRQPGDEPGRHAAATTGCHDITVYQKIGLAAGACTGEGAIIDIKDPVNPKVIASVEDPNFAFWHSATISQDGKKVLFTDELGGGSAPTCNSTIGPKRGADAVYDITDPANPKFMSYFKIPREQTNQENCVAHNGNAIPVPGRDILIQSWYQGGIVDHRLDRRQEHQGAGLVRPRPVDERGAPGRRPGRLLVDLLLQRVHLRQRDPARLRRLQGDGQRVRRGGPHEGRAR